MKGQTRGVKESHEYAECDEEHESSRNLMTFHTSARQEEKINEAEEDLPSVRYGPVVCGLHCQSIAPPYSELNPWCHNNDSGTVKTIYSVL